MLAEKLARRKRVPLVAPIGDVIFHDMTVLDTDDECSTVPSGSAAPVATEGEASLIDDVVRAEYRTTVVSDDVLLENAVLVASIDPVRTCQSDDDNGTECSTAADCFKKGRRY